MSDKQKAANVPNVSKTETYQWTVELKETHGNCFIGWKTDAPFRAQQSKICLYKDSFPPNPDDRVVAWTWADPNFPNPFDTGQPWGSGWCAALTAQKNPNGPYVYAVKVGPTKAE